MRRPASRAVPRMASIGSFTNTPTVVTVAGNAAAISPARSGSMYRGLPFQNTNPIAVAPSRTAWSASPTRVIPQIFRIGARLAGGFESALIHALRSDPRWHAPDRGRHEPFADQKRAIPGRGQAFEIASGLQT